jgi:hypothetical protein
MYAQAVVHPSSVTPEQTKKESGAAAGAGVSCNFAASQDDLAFGFWGIAFFVPGGDGDKAPCSWRWGA